MSSQIAVPLRSRRPPTSGAAIFALLLPWAALGPTAHAQEGPARDAVAVADDAVSIGFLEGVWDRNEELSEDAMDRFVAVYGEPANIPGWLRDVARSISNQRRGVAIQAEDSQVKIQNAAGEVLRVPVDRGRRLDSRGRLTIAYLAGAALEVVTGGTEWPWLLTETFHRSGDRLVQVTESQNLAFPNLNFRTVYDHAEGKPPPQGPVGVGQVPATAPAAVRIVPPKREHRELLSGPVEVQALIIDPLIDTVEFLLDGKRVSQSRKAPFKARIRLSDPPREQTIEVRAYRDTRIRLVTNGAGNTGANTTLEVGGYRDDGTYLGSDRLVLNALDSPFAVRITDLRPLPGENGSGVAVAARVSVPRTAALASVEFYRGERRVAAYDGPDLRERHDESRTISVDAVVENTSPGDFVRVAARLADGRELEDAELLRGSEYKSEIDVHLVQLQVLAVDRDGKPISGLKPEDLEIRENGVRRPVEDLHVAGDVPLVLGLAVDSSESMGPVWHQLQGVVRSFMTRALDAQDRAFLVDFDHTVRLLQPLTGDRPLLAARLNRLLAEGGTALNDGLLFSLLQFRREPGRRALVVLTDGDDQHSRMRAARVTDFAERLGIPIYFIAVGWADPPRDPVRKLSRRTGGRLFRIHPSLPPSERAVETRKVFDRIDEDLRHQHVLTYYSNLPAGEGIEPEVRSLRNGLTVKSVLPLEGIE